MKRKIFQILLMVTVTVSLGIFVSCKDTSGDWRSELETQIQSGNADLATLMAQHQTDIATLQGIIDNLKGQIPSTDNQQALNDLMDLIFSSAGHEDLNLKSMKDLIDLITNNYNTFITYTENIGVSRQMLDSAMNVLKREFEHGDTVNLERIIKVEQDLTKVSTTIENVTTRLLQTDSIAKAASSAASQAAKAAKAAGDSSALALQLIRDLEKVAAAADSLSKANEGKIANINTQITQFNNRFYNISDSLLNVYKKADSIYVMAMANKLSIEILDSLVKDNQSSIKDLKNTVIPGLEGNITTLYNKVDSLGKEITGLKEEIPAIKNYADSLYNEAVAYTNAQVANVRADLNALSFDVDSLRDEYEKSVGRIEALDSVVKIINDSIASYNNRITNNDNRIKENTLLISQVENKLDSIAGVFESELAALKTDLSNLEKRVEQNEKDIKKITGELSILQEALKRQVTGIIVQGTYNPAFGSISLPVGVQSNVLLAYYGEATQPVYFPTARKASYVDDKFALTAKDMEMLGGEGAALFNAGDIIMQNEENNAGTLYLTVNPNTVDFSDLQLSLVNSQDKESYVKLGELKRSDKIMQLGYSRAADNGFYECPAYVKSSDVNKVQKVNFNASAIKEDIKEIMNKRTAADFKGIATDLAEVVKGLRLDANAVKCEWADGEEATAAKHSVYSNYNLAATAVKPLSLTTMYGANYKNVPGFERVMAFLDSISSQAKGKVHTVFKELNGSALVEKIVNLKIKNIEVPDLSDDLLQEFILHMDTTFVMDGLTYHLQMPVDVEIPVKFEKDLLIPVKMNGVEVSVPVDIEKSVEVDLSKVSITTPTVVVKGSASGYPTNVHDADGNPIAALVIPVLDGAGNVTGYTEIPMDSLNVRVDLEANNKEGGAGDLIYLNGSPVAKVEIHENMTGTVDIDTVLTYHLVVEDTFKKTITLDKVFNFGDNGGTSKTFNLVFKYDMTKSAKDLWGVAQDALNNINDGLLSDLRDIIDEVNNALAQINGYEDKIDTTIDTYMDKVESYLKKANKKIVDFVNNINSRLQPVMLASDGTGTKFLSGAKKYPTELGRNISFVPTTWTLELAVPIAKKHIAITNVMKDGKSAKGGDGTCKAELVRANSSATLNKVLSGEVRRAYASDLKVGYTYEIAYSALDFHGKISTRKYYITIK